MPGPLAGLPARAPRPDSKEGTSTALGGAAGSKTSLRRGPRAQGGAVSAEGGPWKCKQIRKLAARMKGRSVSAAGKGLPEAPPQI